VPLGKPLVSSECLELLQRAPILKNGMSGNASPADLQAQVSELGSIARCVPRLAVRGRPR
jgi:hypothetical protein